MIYCHMNCHSIRSIIVYFKCLFQLVCLYIRRRGEDECGADCADWCCGYRHVLLASHCLCYTQQKTGNFSFSIFQSHNSLCPHVKGLLRPQLPFAFVSSYNYTPYSGLWSFLLPMFQHDYMLYVWDSLGGTWYHIVITNERMGVTHWSS